MFNIMKISKNVNENMQLGDKVIQPSKRFINMRTALHGAVKILRAVSSMDASALSDIMWVLLFPRGVEKHYYEYSG